MKQPIYLFSDSQLLFWKVEGQYFIKNFLTTGRQDCDHKAAYIGASNGDNPDYFEIFRSSMKVIKVNNCSLIPSNPETKDLEFLKTSDIILLAGGDVKLGLETMLENGVADVVRKRYLEGATLIGISAGAIQLSLMSYAEDQPYDTFQLVPFIIDVHDEANNWKRLRNFMAMNPGFEAYGIPFGAGLVYQQDGSMEMLRHRPFEC